MKRYLVPFDGSEHSEAALRYACQFARGVDGELTVIFIADERAVANPIFDLTVLALQGIGTLGDLIPREKARLELQAKLLVRGEEILKGISEWEELSQSAENPVKYQTSVVVASPPDYLVEKSADYDVLFMGLYGEMHSFKGGLWGGTSEAVIRKGASPVLIATSEYKPFSSLIVGFDNRPRSRQALAWAGLISENMKIPVTVLTCESDKSKASLIADQTQEIIKSFDSVFRHEFSERKPIEFILGWIAENPGSLVCLGAFGDQPIREFFLGSVAEAVLRKSNNPVMLFK